MKLFNIFILFPLISSLTNFNSINNKSYEKEMIVCVNNNSDFIRMNEFLSYLNIKDIRFNNVESLNNLKSNYYKINFQSQIHYEIALQILNNEDNILFVEENKTYSIDESADNNVSNNNLRILSKKVNYEIIESESAKELPGNNDVINVAVIDSGVNFNSTLLTNKLDNTYSKSFIDGRDYDNFRSSHGTTVSYIIGGSSNNSLFESGVCENINIISIMIPKDCELWDFISAMNYINNLPIDIQLINCSYSMGGDNSLSFKNSIQNFDGLFICSAANDNLNLDTNFVYPAKYSLENMIVVGESTIYDSKSSISNYSDSLVDIFAPSYGIYSIDDNDEFQDCYGTSFAAPLVTGACALMLSKNKNLSSSQVKNQIMKYADKLDSLKDYCVDGNRLNVFNSIHASNHEYTYSTLSTSKHLGLCNYCENTIEEGHVLKGGTIISGNRYGICIKCGGKVEIGFINNSRSLYLEEYDFINGLYYPKITQVINDIVDLSYEDSLKYE